MRSTDKNQPPLISSPPPSSPSLLSHLLSSPRLFPFLSYPLLLSSPPQGTEGVYSPVFSPLSGSDLNRRHMLYVMLLGYKFTPVKVKKKDHITDLTPTASLGNIPK